jgi:hypothetical protein
MQRRGGAALVELAVAAHRWANTRPPPRAARVPSAPRRPGAAGRTHRRPARAAPEARRHLVQVLDRQRVALPAPPTGHHPLGQHDQIARVLLAVHREPAEAVVLQASHTVPVPALGTGQSRGPSGIAFRRPTGGRPVGARGREVCGAADGIGISSTVARGRWGTSAAAGTSPRRRRPPTVARCDSSVMGIGGCDRTVPAAGRTAHRRRSCAGRRPRSSRGG